MKEATPRNAYHLLVELSEFDPATASPGDWLNFEARLTELVRLVSKTASSSIRNIADPLERQALEATLRPIHTDLRRLVRQYSRGSGPFTVGDPEVTIQTVPIANVRVAALPITGLTVALFGRPRLVPRFVVEGDLHSTAILATILLLNHGERGAPIAICPEDDRLFVRSRRQQYCSRRCVNRVNVRTYRAALLERIAKKQQAATRKKRTTTKKRTASKRRTT